MDWTGEMGPYDTAVPVHTTTGGVRDTVTAQRHGAIPRTVYATNTRRVKWAPAEATSGRGRCVCVCSCSTRVLVRGPGIRLLFVLGHDVRQIPSGEARQRRTREQSVRWGECMFRPTRRVSLNIRRRFMYPNVGGLSRRVGAENRRANRTFRAGKVHRRRGGVVRPTGRESEPSRGSLVHAQGREDKA